MGVAGSGIAAGTVVTSWNSTTKVMGISNAIEGSAVSIGDALTIEPMAEAASSDDECQTFCDLTEVRKRWGGEKRVERGRE